MIEKKNFAGQATPSIVDTEYRNCNFSMKMPADAAEKILPGILETFVRNINNKLVK